MNLFFSNFLNFIFLYRMSKKRRKTCLLIITLFFLQQILYVDTEILSVLFGATAASGLGFFIGDFGGFYSAAKCKFYECCREPWINKNIAQNLEMDVEERLYGQHIARKVVINAVRAHISKTNPSKALVMSFHGWTGTGKNYLAKMISKALYKKEMHSQFVHLYVATLHFPHVEETEKYKTQLQKWIAGNLTLCERSVFIFDEIDKLPMNFLDAIIPFIDFYDRINGIDARKSIFIFLSNGGANLIAQRTLEYYNRGQSREDITFKELEELTQISSFNEGEGGLKMSRLITKHLIDYFVPFLPLERRHIVMCFKDYLRSKNVSYTTEQLERMVDSLQYFPKGMPIFSTSGCKQVESKAEYLIADFRDEL